MIFKIDRLTWLRGEGNDESYLYRDEDAKLCCLGQIGQQCGIGLEFLSMEPNPSNVDSECLSLWPHALLCKEHPDITDSQLGNKMMSVNDDEHLTDKERESKLITLCAPHGIELEFTN